MPVICPIQDTCLGASWALKRILCQKFVKKHQKIDSKNEKITTYSQKIVKIRLYIELMLIFIEKPRCCGMLPIHKQNR